MTTYVISVQLHNGDRLNRSFKSLEKMLDWLNGLDKQYDYNQKVTVRHAFKVFEDDKNRVEKVDSTMSILDFLNKLRKEAKKWFISDYPGMAHLQILKC